MADLNITCPACGKITAVSEYIGEAALACPACGQSIPIVKAVRPAGPKLRLQSAAAPAPAAPVAAAPSDTLNTISRQPAASLLSQQDARRIRRQRLRIVASWLLFILLTAGLYFLRYLPGWPDLPLDTLKLYGRIAIGAAYLIIIILALRDNMVNGLLALLVPFYPFYYLYFFSSALWLRAAVGSLLVIFGFDTLIWLQAVLTAVYDRIQYWIKNV